MVATNVTMCARGQYCEAPFSSVEEPAARVELLVG